MFYESDLKQLFIFLIFAMMPTQQVFCSKSGFYIVPYVIF